MRKQYDFFRGRRGPLFPVQKGKTRVTIRLDDDVLARFHDRVEAAGGGSYQGATNAALREHIRGTEEALKETLRRVIREELKRKG